MQSSVPVLPAAKWHDAEEYHRMRRGVQTSDTGADDFLWLTFDCGDHAVASLPFAEKYLAKSRGTDPYR